MSWSRFFRMLMLGGVGAAFIFALSQSVLTLFKKRRMGAQNPVEVAPPAQVVQPTGLRTSPLQRVALIAGVTLVVLAILGQVLFALHVPMPSVLAFGNNASTGATFITQPPAVTVTRLRTFETGIVTPQWQQQTAYGPQWQQSLPAIQTGTGAQWIELSLLFSQATSTSTTVTTTQSTPLVSAFAAGVRAAHARGLHVFVVPLISVSEQGGWAGSIRLDSQEQQKAWFDSYWNTYKPYVEAAAQAGADQMAIATECSWLQQNAPATLWNELINRVHNVFAGMLTYDMNWYPVDQPIPTWFNNKHINMIGVSSYIPLIDTPTRVDPKDMPSLWRDKVLSVLDKISTRIGKPVLVSEIGYRNSADALYNTWLQDSTTPLDPAEQAGAYDAALSNVVPDQHIAGIFFWGWEDVGKFTLKGQDMTNAVLHKWYTSVR